MNAFLHGPEILATIQEVSRSATTRCAVPYITRDGMRMLLESRMRALQLVTQVRLADVTSGAMCLDALQDAMNAGAFIRLLPAGPRLHAKVVVSDRAVVGSANLTRSALTANVEAAVLVTGEAVAKVHQWMDQLWSQAQALTRHDLERFRKVVADLHTTPPQVPDRVLAPRPADAMKRAVDLASTDVPTAKSKPGVFLCNSGQKHHASWEEWMLTNDVAAAWLDFKHPSAFEAVRSGDLILLYSNRTGVVACGLAAASHAVIPGTLPRRFEDEPKADCYEIPVAWQRLNPPLPWPNVTPGTFAEVGEATSANRMSQIAKALSMLDRD